MTKVNFSKIFIAVVAIMIVSVTSCGGGSSSKQVNKNQYERVALKDAGTGTIVGTSEPNANETRLYASKVKYRELPESIKTAIGLSKGQVAFADPETDVITPFSVKGHLPDLKNGQVVTIYFRLIRKNGRIDKLEIDLAETD